MSPDTDFIPYAKPSLGPEEEAAVISVLRSGWLTTGQVTRAFEEEFASFVRTEAALAVNSATSGLHLALEALGVGPGDLVATTPYTFVSTAAVARHLGAEVRFCDIAKDDYNMDPGALDALLAREKKIKVVLPIHIGGKPCRMEEILEISRRHGAFVVEDAAHAFPVRTEAGYAGTLGDIGVYSFYANKTMTTGEGGMIVARDPSLRKRMALMRSHGFDRDAWDRYTSTKPAWYYDVIEAGYKYNLPDLLAAIGREQLRKAEAFLEERRAIASAYLAAFASLPEIELPPLHPAHSWHIFALRLRPGALTIGRDEFIQRLAARGIGSSVHFIPLHTMKYWAGRYGFKPEDFPEAWDKFSRSLSIPIWHGMAAAQRDRVIEAVGAVVAETRA
jgi:dTDP-4-amino-4,6-dideoxygalactose transaminase